MPFRSPGAAPCFPPAPTSARRALARPPTGPWTPSNSPTASCTRRVRRAEGAVVRPEHHHPVGVSDRGTGALRHTIFRLASRFRLHAIREQRRSRLGGDPLFGWPSRPVLPHPSAGSWNHRALEFHVDLGFRIAWNSSRSGPGRARPGWEDGTGTLQISKRQALVSAVAFFVIACATEDSSPISGDGGSGAGGTGGISAGVRAAKSCPEVRAAPKGAQAAARAARAGSVARVAREAPAEVGARSRLPSAAMVSWTRERNVTSAPETDPSRPARPNAGCREPVRTRST